VSSFFSFKIKKIGNIVQIDNEFKPLEWDQGEPTKAYNSWDTSMAVGLNTGVPWIICKQDDALDVVYKKNFV
jgi:hypothetical protein